LEGLSTLSLRGNSEDVEADGLGQWAALSNCDLVTILNTESRRDVSRDVLVTLLVSLVLWDVVEVVTTNDEGSVHLCGDDNTAEDTATDRYETGEWALLVDVVSFNGVLWRLEAQTNILVPSSSTLSNSSLCGAGLLGGENVRLLLESALRLNGQFGGHFAGLSLAFCC
jgi:hypothetical protein